MDSHYDGELWQSREFFGNASLLVEVIYNKSLVMFFFKYITASASTVLRQDKHSRSQQVKEYSHRCCGRRTGLKLQSTFNIRRSSRYIKDHCVFIMLTFNIVFFDALKTGVKMFAASS
jgi:inorganic triphosphatase YgiF